MLMGRVIGTVWCTRKDEKLTGMKFLVVQEVDLDRKPVGGFHVCVDTVQAGLGEFVLVARGSSARQTTETQGKPVDAVIMAVIENLQVTPQAELDAEYSERLAAVDALLEEVGEV